MLTRWRRYATNTESALLTQNVSSRKKVVFVSLRFPFPSYGGEKVDALSYLKVFDDLGFDIVLVAVGEKKAVSNERIISLRRLVPNLVDVHVLRSNLLVSAVGAALYGLFGKPLQVGFFSASLMMSQKIRRLLSESDTIFIQTIRFWPLISRSTVEKTNLLFADSISRNYRLAASHYRGLVSFLFAIEGWLMFRYERFVCSQTLSSGIFHSRTDIDYLTQQNNRRIVAIPIIKERVPAFKEIDSLTARRAVFVGNFSYFPNALALKMLLENAEKLSELGIRIDLIGSDMPSELVPLIERSESITYLGVVPDLESVILDSYCVICPVNVGAGMQNKILDGLSAGRCVLASYFSAQPYFHYIKETDSKKVGILTFKDFDEFAATLRFILNDSAIANQFGRAAYEVAKSFEFSVLKNEVSKFVRA